MTLLVLGAGNFGTSLAHHLATQGHEVILWSRSQLIVNSINNNGKNCKYLPTINLSSKIKATTDLNQAVQESDGPVVIAIPTQGVRALLQLFDADFLGSSGRFLICCYKGIELGTYCFPLQIVADVLGDDFAHGSVVLSGPTFAAEVVEHLPTCVAVAGKHQANLLQSQKIFHANCFRVYTSEDPRGLEVAGAFKNIIAIAAGACSGLGFAHNSLAALITRGLAEITRIGLKLGAQSLTFNGLGGVGDLFLTCTSQKSRNFRLGYELGQGNSLERAIDNLGSTAEGVSSAQAGYELAQKHQVYMPITEQVYQVLYGKKDIKDAVNDLISGESKPEII